MSNVPLQRYDFAAAARVKRPLRQKMMAWFGKSASRFSETWSQVSRTEASAICQTIDSHTFEQRQRQWGSDRCGFHFNFGAGDVAAMVCVTRQQLRILLMDVLGGDDSVPESPKLSTIETSLAVLIFEMLIASISECWFALTPLEFELGEIETAPNRCRRFSAATDVLTCEYVIGIKGHSVSIEFLFGKQSIMNLLEIPVEETTVQSAASVGQHLIGRVEVELVAKLGQVSVDVNELSAFEPGDVIVLDQPVGDSLEVHVNGEPLFRAWPGRQSTQRVIQVSTI